jgi:hypothetical protein
MSISLRALEAALAGLSISSIEPFPALDERHLGRQVVALEHLHRFITASEEHVVSSTVSAATQ